MVGIAGDGATMLTMTLNRRFIPALALTAVSAMIAMIMVPGEAEACDPGPCQGVRIIDQLNPVNAALIPSDGVLVLQAAGKFIDGDWSAAVSLDVSLDGQPVAGAF